MFQAKGFRKWSRRSQVLLDSVTLPLTGLPWDTGMGNFDLGSKNFFPIPGLQRSVWNVACWFKVLARSGGKIQHSIMTLNCKDSLKDISITLIIGINHRQDTTAKIIINCSSFNSQLCASRVDTVHHSTTLPMTRKNCSSSRWQIDDGSLQPTCIDIAAIQWPAFGQLHRKLVHAMRLL